MPENIEIKARARDFQRQCMLAGQVSGSPGEIIFQVDTFFDVPKGRLKLRVLSHSQAELIYYERGDIAGPKRSEYYVVQTSTPEPLAAVLGATLHALGTVTKKRTVHRVGQTRIHLDEVEGLGFFIEIEVVLLPGQTEDEGAGIAQNLMENLEISAEDLVAQAYVDLLAPAFERHR